MENPKISFIIPVYNVEKYLEDCIESILKQMTSECEIILIDDGSSDNSGEICDIYSKKQNGIKVYHKKNGGVSSARNLGIEKATGKYIAFVDADDIISECAVESLLSWVKDTDVDMCFLDAVKLYPDLKEEPLDEPLDRRHIYKKDTGYVIKYLSTKGKYRGSSCSKLFKYEFLINNNLRFPCNVAHAEDLTFVRDCILEAQSFDYLPIPYYKYRQNREGSCTNSIGDKSFFELAKFIDDSVNILTKDKKAIDNKSLYFMNFVSYEFMILMYNMQYVSKSRKKEAHKIARQNKWVLKYHDSFKTKVVYLLSRFLGVQITSQILYYYMRFR